MKRYILIFVIAVLTAVTISCSPEKKPALRFRFAGKEEAVSRYLSHEEYFSKFSDCDLEYKLQKKGGTIEELKEFGSKQMLDFTDAEKELLEKVFQEMEKDIEMRGVKIPDVGEVTLIKSTGDEEGGAGAYTHGTEIYLSQILLDSMAEDEEDRRGGRNVLWHEVFHILSRNDPGFRKSMYDIIHFTVGEKDYEVPEEVMEKYISNPDVERHDSSAVFRINGKDVECYTVLIAEHPFRKEGDSFFDCMKTALVPTEGKGEYYLPEDTDNFLDIFGRNTDYVIDPEECMADNFGLAMTYGEKGSFLPDPEIIEQVIERLR